jgi:hypothetical protein
MQREEHVAEDVEDRTTDADGGLFKIQMGEHVEIWMEEDTEMQIEEYIKL